MVECALAQKKMRPFSKLIGCFSRIADELGIEANQDGLQLRAVSLAQSGYIGAQLPSRFFDHWQLEKRVPRCKVALKVRVYCRSHLIVVATSRDSQDGRERREVQLEDRRSRM